MCLIISHAFSVLHLLLPISVLQTKIIHCNVVNQCLYSIWPLCFYIAFINESTLHVKAARLLVISRVRKKTLDTRTKEQIKCATTTAKKYQEKLSQEGNELCL